MDEQSRRQVPGEFRIVKYDVRDFIGDYRSMEYGDPNEARTAQLRDEFDLERVVAHCDSEFDGFLALKRWVRSRWNHGWSHSFDKVKDALDILREAARGELFTCGYYTLVLAQCATALGWPARRVGISLADCEFPRDYRLGNIGHSVAEMWSNEREKWVLMDPDTNVHYERDGVPLNALEIRDAWLGGCADEVRMIQDQPPPVVPSGRTVEILRERMAYLRDYDDQAVRLLLERFGRHRMMDYYARVAIAGREWVDDRCLPTFIKHFGAAGETRWTSSMADMYWSVNMVRISAAAEWDESGARLKVSLDHCMPFFDHYEVRVDGGTWEPRSADFDWPMHEGINSVECRGVNVMNRRGIVSSMDVAYAGPRI